MKVKYPVMEHEDLKLLSINNLSSVKDGLAESSLILIMKSNRHDNADS